MDGGLTKAQVGFNDYQGFDEFRNCGINIKISITKKPQKKIFVAPAILSNW